MNQLPNLSQIIHDTFSKLINQSSTFISNLLSAIVILVIGWLVAKICSWVIRTALEKLGADKLGEKIQDLEVLKKYKLEFKLSKLIATVAYVFIMLFLSVSAADTLGVPAISNMFLMLVNFIPKLIVALIMILVGLFIADYARKFVETICKSFNISSGKLIGMAVFFFISFISIILALGQAGINTKLLESSFNIIIAALALSFSIGYGIASKEILVNILGSIYSRKRYQEGDVVEIQGVKGTVVRIDNTTFVLNSNGNEVSFPTKLLQSEKITLYNQNN